MCTEEEVDYFFELVAHVLPDDPRRPRRRSSTASRACGRCPATTSSRPGSSRATTASSGAELAGRPGTTRAEPRRRQVDHVPRPRRAPLRRGAGGSSGAIGVRSTKGLAIGGGARLSHDRRRPRACGSTSYGDGVGRERAASCSSATARAAEVYRGEIEGEQETALRTPPVVQHAPRSPGSLRNERVVHLADLVLRRTSIAFTGALTAPLLDELADVAAEVLGWSAARRSDEIATTRALVAERHGIRLAEGAAVGT